MIESLEKERNPKLSQDVPKLLNVTENDRIDLLKHYNVSSKGLQDIIYSIQEWYEKQSHLPKGKLDSHMIFQHLMLKGFSIEEVKDKIDNCVSAKRKMPELLLNRDPLHPSMNECLKFGFFVILPKKTPRNHRVSIFRIKQPVDLVVSDVVKMALMFLTYRMYNDTSLGEQWIFDLTNISFHNSVQMTPAVLTKLVYFIRFCYGGKIKGIHFTNMPSFIIPIMNILKKLIKPKIAKRIYVYKNFNELSDLFSKSILPKEYGGDEITCDEITENWRKAIQSDAWIEYFMEQDKVMSDEALRTRFLSSDDFFGLEEEVFRIKSPRELVVTDVIKLACMILEYRRYTDVSVGEQYIYDLSNARFSNAVQMTPPLVTKAMYYIRYCSEARIKGIHFINMPAFVTPILGLIKKLLKPKIAGRIKLHSKPEEIAELFPRSILPIEYGGEEFSFEKIAENWRKSFQTDIWRQYFLDQDKLFSDDSKRTRVLNCDEIFGCEGSFRKLEFD